MDAAKKRGVVLLVLIFFLLAGGFLFSFHTQSISTGSITGAAIVENGLEIPSEESKEKGLLISPEISEKELRIPREENTPPSETPLSQENELQMPPEKLLSLSEEFSVLHSGYKAGTANGSQCGGVNQSITLTTNIAVTGNCFIINVSNIVIDGSSFSVQGINTGAGVNSTNFTNITIKNIRFLNFSVGIYFENTNRSLITNSSVQNSTIGMYLSVGSELNNISSNRLVNNSLLGLLIQNSNNNTIYNNYFSNNSNHANDNATNKWNISPSCDLTTRPRQEVVSIIGGPCLGGNFFSNYSQNITTFDGLGSALYFIPGGSNNDSLSLEENISLGCQIFSRTRNLSTEYGPLTIVGAADSATYGCIIANATHVVLDGQGTKIVQRIADQAGGVLGFGILANASNVTLKNFVVEGWSVGTPLQTAYGRTNLTLINITLRNMNSTALDYAFSFAGNSSTFANLTVYNTSSEVYALGIFQIGPTLPNTFTDVNFTNVYGGLVLRDLYNSTFENLTTNNITKYNFYEFGCDTRYVTAGECRNTIFTLKSPTTDAVRYKTNNKAGTQGIYVFDLKQRIRVNITNNTKGALSGVTVEVKNVNDEVEDTQQTDAEGLTTLTAIESVTISGLGELRTPHIFSAKKGNYSSYYTLQTLSSSTGQFFALETFLKGVNCGEIMNNSILLGRDLTCGDQSALSLAGFPYLPGFPSLGLFTPTVDGGGFSLISPLQNNNGLLGSNRGSGILVKNLRFVNFTEGINLVNMNHTTLRNLLFHNNSIGIYFSNATNNTLYESNVANSTVAAIDTNGFGRNCFVNSTVQVDNITVANEAEVCRKWYVTVNVTFNGGIALPNANVYVYSNYTHDFEDSGFTDDDGLIRFEVTDLVKNASGYIYKSPHNISMNYTSATGVVTNYTVLNISLTNNTYINFSVTLDCTVPRQDFNITNNTILCPGTYRIEDEQGKVGVILFNETGASNVKLTCDNTKIIGKDKGVGLAATNKRNITVTGCTFQDYDEGILFSDVNFSLINNSVIQGMDENGILLRDSFSNTLSYSQIKDSAGTSENGLLFRGSANNTIHNNTFTNNTIQVYFDDGYAYFSENNTFYFNRFTSTGSSDVFQRKTEYFENFFNKTITWGDGTKNFGNYYAFACSLQLRDNDDDGVYNTGDDFPYNHSAARVTKSDAYGVDYAPLLVTCASAASAAAEAARAAAGGAGGSAAAASASAEAAAPAAVASPAQAAEGLSASVSSTGSDGGGSLVLRLRNEGETTIVLERVLEETPSEVENGETLTERWRSKGLSEEEIKNRLSLITQNPQTLQGRGGSIFGTLQPVSDITPSGDLVQGDVTQPQLPPPETFVLPPCSQDPRGCQMEKPIEIIGSNFLVQERGVVVKIIVAGTVISELPITIGGTSQAGTAVSYTSFPPEQNLDEEPPQDGSPAPTATAVGISMPEQQNAHTYTGVLDLYAIIPPSKEQRDYWVEFDINTPTGKASSLTGAAVGLTENITLASDLLGPFRVEQNQSILVTQQYLHTDAYQGPAEVVMKIRQDGKVISEKRFPVVFVETTGVREGISSWIFYLAVLLFFLALLLPVVFHIIISRKGLPKMSSKQ